MCRECTLCGGAARGSFAACVFPYIFLSCRFTSFSMRARSCTKRDIGRHFLALLTVIASDFVRRLFVRRGPDLTVILDSEARFAADNPVIFSAQYSILPARLANERLHGQLELLSLPAPTSASPTECPLECTQRNERRACRLVSPGYPGVYPRGVSCRVALESSAGRFRIGGNPDDVYNLMNHTSQEACSTEFCEQEHVDAAPSAAPSADQPDDQRTLPKGRNGEYALGHFRFEGGGGCQLRQRDFSSFVINASDCGGVIRWFAYYN